MLVEPEYIYSGFIWSVNLENPTFPKYTQPQTNLPHVHHIPHEFGELPSNWSCLAAFRSQAANLASASYQLPCFHLTRKPDPYIFFFPFGNDANHLEKVPNSNID